MGLKPALELMLAVLPTAQLHPEPLPIPTGTNKNGSPQFNRVHKGALYRIVTRDKKGGEGSSPELDRTSTRLGGDKVYLPVTGFSSLLLTAIAGVMMGVGAILTRIGLRK